MSFINSVARHGCLFLASVDNRVEILFANDVVSISQESVDDNIFTYSIALDNPNHPLAIIKSTMGPCKFGKMVAEEQRKFPKPAGFQIPNRVNTLKNKYGMNS